MRRLVLRISTANLPFSFDQRETTPGQRALRQPAQEPKQQLEFAKFTRSRSPNRQRQGPQ